MARSNIGRLTGLLLLLLAGACRAGPWVELGGERFQVELARTHAEQARGLMFRERLPGDQGMLFVYEQEGWRSFWMKNTRIPLDILFFDAQKRLINWHSAEPCESDPCPGYPSEAPAQYVLELNSGTAAKLGLSPGDTLDLHVEQ